MNYPARTQFEASVKLEPGTLKYVFLTDIAYYAETLQPTGGGDSEYSSVYITLKPQSEAYTVEEFHNFICGYDSKTLHVGDFFYILLCSSKSRSDALQRALDDRLAIYSNDAWKAFTSGPDYFKQNPGKLFEAAQFVVDRAEGRTQKGNRASDSQGTTQNDTSTDSLSHDGDKEKKPKRYICHGGKNNSTFAEKS